MIDLFLTYIRYELNYSAHTVAAYKTDLRQFADWMSEQIDKEPREGKADAMGKTATECVTEVTAGGMDIDVERVSLGHLRRWLGALGREGYAARSIRRKTLAVKAFFHFLHKTGRISENPVADITLTKIDSPLPHIVKEQELEEILADENFAGDDFVRVRNLLIIDILYSTGIRRAELMALCDKDVDGFRREIKVTGKRNKQRVIPVAPKLLKRIWDYQRLRDERFGEKGSSGQLIVTNSGKAMNNSTLTYIVNNELASTTASKRTPHVLRHTFASTLLNHGAEINSVKELLGHNSLSTTQIYTHLSFSELKQNYEHAHPRATKK